MRGYETFSNVPDITKSERTELEMLGFGQTEDPKYMDSLATQPAALGRPLSTGRYALTRCLKGDIDSAGRQTTLFVTLVFSSETWTNYASKVCYPLLRQNEIWNRCLHSDDNSPISLTIPDSYEIRSPSSTVLPIIDSWLCMQSPKDLLGLPDESSTTLAVSEIPQMLPTTERLQIAWGLRILSSSAPVTIATLAQIDTIGRRRIIHTEFKSSYTHDYTNAIAMYWSRQKRFPREFCDGIGSIDQVNAVPHDPKDIEISSIDSSNNKRMTHLSSQHIIYFCLGILATASVFCTFYLVDEDNYELDYLLRNSNQWTIEALEQWIKDVNDLGDTNSDSMSQIRIPRIAATQMLNWINDVKQWLIDAESILANTNHQPPLDEDEVRLIKRVNVKGRILRSANKLQIFSSLRSYHINLIENKLDKLDGLLTNDIDVSERISIRQYDIMHDQLSKLHESIEAIDQIIENFEESDDKFSDIGEIKDRPILKEYDRFKDHIKILHERDDAYGKTTERNDKLIENIEETQTYLRRLRNAVNKLRNKFQLQLEKEDAETTIDPKPPDTDNGSTQTEEPEDQADSGG